ncbi:MAG: BamA/OMP85 family outer membrane protein [Schwartzia sp. (in: firmicutes)]
MEKKLYRTLTCTAALTASLALLGASGVSAAPDSAAAGGTDVVTTEGELSLPDISSAPEHVVPVGEATPEQLARVTPPPPPPTAEEIAAEEEARARAAAEAAAQAERERAAAEAKAAQEAAKAEATARAQEDANRVDAELKTGAVPAQPAAMPVEGEEKAAEEDGEESDSPVAAAPTTPAAVPATESQAESEADRWARLRPEEQRIAAWVDSLEGKTIVDVAVEGAGNTTAEAAKAALQTRPGDTFSRARIETDRTAIYDVGLFYDIFPTFSLIPEGVLVTYHVLENPILTSVEITGNTVLATEEIAPLITVQPGEMLNTKTLRGNMQDITNRYHRDGYILAKVGDLDIARDGKLTIRINEGTLEGYVVKGNTKTKERVVLREMRMKTGEPFNAKKARRSMQRVYNLGYFDDVNMKLNPGVEPNAVILEVDVVEKRTGNFTVGAGYSSQDGFIGMIGIGDKNFRGTGDSINLTYEFSGDDSDAHGYTFSYRRPWLDKKETAGTLRIYNRTYEYDDYDTNGDEIEAYMRKYSGGEITLSRPQSEYSTNFITLRHRDDRYVRHQGGRFNRSGAGAKEWRDDNFGLTRSLILEHVTDTRDNIYSPMTGNRASLSFEFAGLGGDFNYRKFTLEDTLYLKAGRAQVFALRGMYGRGFGHISESDVFRIGGQNALRGYRDDQFRDNNVFLGTVEYRFPVVSKVQGALFADFGGTWSTGWMPKNLHQGIGFGLAVQTPVGPIRIDLARGSQGNRVHFSVGGSF